MGATHKKKTFPLWHGALVAGTVESQQEGRPFVFQCGACMDVRMDLLQRPVSCEDWRL